MVWLSLIHIFISVETTVDEVTDWLQARGITHLNAAYGCSPVSYTHLDVYKRQGLVNGFAHPGVPCRFLGFGLFYDR